jgi:hypothetical protein
LHSSDRQPCWIPQISVSERTRDRFAKLAGVTGGPVSKLLEGAPETLERRVFFDQLAAGYKALRADLARGEGGLGAAACGERLAGAGKPRRHGVNSALSLGRGSG